MLGLNDYYIPRHPPANFGKGFLAHELGDANYIMKRNPDIVIFDTGGTASFNVGEQLIKNKIFTSNYVKVLSKNDTEEYIMYLNKYGNSSGVKLNQNELVIPGYLLDHTTDTISYFSGKKLYKNIINDNMYEIVLDGMPNKEWYVKKINSNKKITHFQSDVSYKNRQMKITFMLQNDALLESLVLEQKN
jgi:hypothetical protein